MPMMLFAYITSLFFKDISHEIRDNRSMAIDTTRDSNSGPTNGHEHTRNNEMRISAHSHAVIGSVLSQCRMKDATNSALKHVCSQVWHNKCMC